MRRTMSEQRSYLPKAIAEAVAPYGPDESTSPHTKISISLPSDLVKVVREAAAESGLSVSATIGASIRRMLAEVEQQSLDRALELDAEENLAWANAYLPIAAKLWSEIEW
jgi:Arc/MetJ-type ribon-helix-helix transcriptional regulator